jgi:hypothetical protein
MENGKHIGDEYAGALDHKPALSHDPVSLEDIVSPEPPEPWLHLS